jgi:adenosyl cobinamide kinase/adenosyl cobinamide phosphate guanylyltransferase
LEAQKTASSQGNTEKKEQHWKYHNKNTQLQTVLQNHSNKNSMVLTQKQEGKPLE